MLADPYTSPYLVHGGCHGCICAEIDEKGHYESWTHQDISHPK